MTYFTDRHRSLHRILDSDDHGPPPHDELDSLLRSWHRENADLATRSRESTLQAVMMDGAPDTSLARPVLARIGHALTGRLARVAACIALVGVIATAMLMPSRQDAVASELIVADGGALTALTRDEEGAVELLGPCPLQHTDIDAEITGPFTRVTLKQRFANPYPQKIEAIYTFPMSHRSAVDSMRIHIKGPSGERSIEGEVKERNQARQIYESAKAAGYVASLLEQERPNIFTQSVANIEPGATVVVEISYLETLERHDGEYSFAFPMTVAPRYIPGTPSSSPTALPEGLVARNGLVLLGPAQVEVTTPDASITSTAAQQLIAKAQPIRTPTPEWFDRGVTSNGPAVDFVATYANGAKEMGQIYAGGVGQVGRRWFWFGGSGSGGGGFAADTNQVPDADRITPMPVKPPERSGHDVSMRVTIDTGGAPLTDVRSELHEVDTTRDGGRTLITLKERDAIPNRDFILHWKTDANLVASGVFAHMRTTNDLTRGGYVAVILDPPARLNDDDAPPRELIFVLDTSGSMNGFPIEKAKDVMTKAIASMRPRDTFNVVTFSNVTNVLWPISQPASEENKSAASFFVNARQSGGGTEMMAAINAALKPLDGAGWITPDQVVELPADGRAVKVLAPLPQFNAATSSISLDDGRSLRVLMGTTIPTVPDAAERTLALEGTWVTKDGDRLFMVDRASFERSSVSPTRIVLFLTDGLVGNDGAIMQAVRDNARTTRVFSFGIGQSVNRSLLEGIALEGRGACDIVTLGADADAVVERFVKRFRNPVLVDIGVAFDGVTVTDLMPAPGEIPDLFDEQPLMLLGRYETPGAGTVTIRGRNGNGEWTKMLPVTLPAGGAAHAAVPTLWARAKVESIIAPKREAVEAQSVDAQTRAAIVALGEAYRILTPFTSFVAVERGRVTVGGSPMLVQVPIELPEGTSWKGFFGDGVAPAAWLAMQPVGGGADARRNAAETRLGALGRLYAAQPEAPVFAADADGVPTHLSTVHKEYFRFLAARVDASAKEALVRESLAEARSLRDAGRYQEAVGLVDKALLADSGNDEIRRLRDALVVMNAVGQPGARKLADRADAVVTFGVDRAREHIQTQRLELARTSLTAAQSRLDRDKAFLDDATYKSKAAAIDALSDEVDRLTTAGAGEPARDAGSKNELIAESLRRVRELQREVRYDEALQVVNEILVIDGTNPVALALRDVTMPLVLFQEAERGAAAHDEADSKLAATTSGEQLRAPVIFDSFPVSASDTLTLGQFTVGGSLDLRLSDLSAAAPANQATVGFIGGLPPAFDAAAFREALSLGLAFDTGAGGGGGRDAHAAYRFGADWNDRQFIAVPDTTGLAEGSAGSVGAAPAKRSAGAVIAPPGSPTGSNVDVTLTGAAGGFGAPEARGAKSNGPKDAGPVPMPAPSATRTITPSAKGTTGDPASAGALPPTKASPPPPPPPPLPAPPMPAPSAAEAEREEKEPPAVTAKAQAKSLPPAPKASSDSPLPQAAEEPAPAAATTKASGSLDLSDAARDLLTRRLERTLLALALAARADAAAALSLARTTEPKLSIDSDGRVRVTILAGKDAGAAEALAAALRRSGVEVDGVDARTAIVVVRTRLDALIALALREDVRRIERFRASTE